MDYEQWKVCAKPIIRCEECFNSIHSSYAGFTSKILLTNTFFMIISVLQCSSTVIRVEPVAQ